MIDRNHDRPMTPQPAGDDWQPCPEGLFGEAARKERERISRRQLLRTAGTAGAVLVSAGVGGLVWRLSTTPPAGDIAKGDPSAEAPISCQECQRLLPDLLRDQVATATRVRMEHHFAKCRHCMAQWTKLKAGHA